jgi:L-lactate dehydrogenase complex protein LldG
MSIDDNRQSRETVLSRVRAALHRDGPDDVPRAAAHAYIAAHRRGPQPAVSGDLVERFLSRASDMASTVERVPAFDAVAAAVGRYVAALDGISADGAKDARAGVCWPEFATLGWRDAGIAIESRPTVGHDSIGITGCCCAIAETGTLVFLTGADSPTATFLLPETHVAIVRADQVVAAMEDAFDRIRSERGALPRAVNFVSGPSRTGDIEQTIVLGAHGPRRLHIVLVG